MRTGRRSANSALGSIKRCFIEKVVVKLDLDYLKNKVKVLFLAKKKKEMFSPDRKNYMSERTASQKDPTGEGRRGDT